MQKHLWQGEWISDETLLNNIENITSFIEPVLGRAFPLEYLLEISQKMHEELSSRGELFEKFVKLAMKTQDASKPKAEAMLDSIISFISKDGLEKKLIAELGSSNPFVIERTSMKEEHFESWMPLGTLVHIAPTNVFTVGVLCVFEGLLSGNINILKTSTNQNRLPQLFLEAFLEFDTKELLKPYIIILEVSSKQKELLQQIIDSADVVSAWGSEEAIKSVQNMTPQGVRFVAWGHKISFAYFAKEKIADRDAMRKVAEDICLLDQNACSSPQDIFVESSDFEVLKNFADSFASVLGEVSPKMPRTTPSSGAEAEISTVLSIAKTEEALGLTYVLRAKDFSWSVIADRRKSLGISPLFRTILIKPLEADEIISVLHPMKSYLQTAALVAPRERVVELSRRLFGAGCLRIREAGHMHDGYIGEPHDGVYALPSFMKKISLLLGDELDRVASFTEFEGSYTRELTNIPIMNKERFQSLEVPKELIDLVVKSGGSSGKPTYAYYTYEDYHAQMKATAYGLYSAGLDPKRDSAINMFAAGHLYGGFLSFHTILEYLKVPHYPMGIMEDTEVVGKLIVEHKINSILSLPTLIMKLFADNKELFKEHKVVKKLFFGGDHFPEEQIEYLKSEFGVELVRAAAYGSNDAGPLGYQCSDCASNEYHLLSSIQELEIFELDSEVKVEDGESGRLIFSSKKRKGQNILRYEIGDTGFINKEPCSCGRVETKYTLQGRSSDVFKAGGPFLHFNKFTDCLEVGFGYSGVSQILLTNEGIDMKLTLKVEDSIGVSGEDVSKYLLKNYEDLHLSCVELGLKLETLLVGSDEFEMVVHSGKIKHIIDKRIAQ
ncbi:MAG: acyl-CoA reductase [Sulfurimonas sp.]|nr:acyl-CoA reductase [Sulfurimonas sp.]MDD3834760.1 acyl-CoA reductase [Sulfurimonas sp.]